MLYIWNIKKSTEFLSIVLKKLNLTNTVNTFHANFRQVQLPPESNFVYLRQNGVHQTKAIRTYFQCERKSTRHNVVLELFSQSICESCFDVLRTKEQLGYIVHSSIREYGGVRGIEIAIQSDRSPVYLNERIENFLDITKVDKACFLPICEYLFCCHLSICMFSCSRIPWKQWMRKSSIHMWRR